MKLGFTRAVLTVALTAAPLLAQAQISVPTLLDAPPEPSTEEQQ